MPSVEHLMASEVAHVEKEKEILTNELLQRNDEFSKMKEVNYVFQQKLDAHVCIVFVQEDYEGPADKLTRVMTELKISENEMRNIQRDFESVMKIIKATENGMDMAKQTVEKYKNDSHIYFQEIKDLKEKVKGNVSRIQAR